ncbi:MAG TPA: winged helix-turn-helix domain-containing protein [Streptosporangiaceae bacterium]|nr:winged helix-turn-helix domain-containing protein [Streptosporangiaceae bacterium]
MTADQLATAAGLLADRTRAAICLALLDHRAWTVGELARHAGVAPSTASEHVARLVDGGMLTAVRQGRSRYVRLAGPQVAELIEGLGAVVATETVAVRSLREASTVKAMARARTCYDHLAGRLGVRITDAMTRARFIDQSAGFSLTQAGLDWLAGALDIDVDGLIAAKRPLVRSCIDWTERRPHLAGGAGAALCGQFFARGWITRTGTSRAVAVTRSGEQVLSALVGVDLTNVA